MLIVEVKLLSLYTEALDKENYRFHVLAILLFLTGGWIDLPKPVTMLGQTVSAYLFCLLF
jgi:hypothetical protein